MVSDDFRRILRQQRRAQQARDDGVRVPCIVYQSDDGREYRRSEPSSSAGSIIPTIILRGCPSDIMDECLRVQNSTP
jgi:hypothetical protein